MRAHALETLNLSYCTHALRLPLHTVAEAAGWLGLTRDGVQRWFDRNLERTLSSWLPRWRLTEAMLHDLDPNEDAFERLGWIESRFGKVPPPEVFFTMLSRSDFVAARSLLRRTDSSPRCPACRLEHHKRTVEGRLLHHEPADYPRRPKW
jgi:hypothetical protein